MDGIQRLNETPLVGAEFLAKNLMLRARMNWGLRKIYPCFFKISSFNTPQLLDFQPLYQQLEKTSLLICHPASSRLWGIYGPVCYRFRRSHSWNDCRAAWKNMKADGENIII